MGSRRCARPWPSTGGDFFADEPYAEWVLPERRRLQNLASDALEALTGIALGEGDTAAAADALARLAELLPYDLAVQRAMMAC